VNPGEELHEIPVESKEVDAWNWNLVSFSGISNPRALSNMGLAIANREDFENYLKAHKKSNFKQTFCYAQKYTDILLTHNASSLKGLPGAPLRHAMEGLSELAKCTGYYDVS
jgi:hypothetical protein